MVKDDNAKISHINGGEPIKFDILYLRQLLLDLASTKLAASINDPKTPMLMQSMASAKRNLSSADSCSNTLEICNRLCNPDNAVVEKSTVSGRNTRKFVTAARPSDDRKNSAHFSWVKRK
jgi:hypothetical protein